MNILFLEQYGELGGAQLCLLDLLPAIRQQGWRAYVAAPGGGELPERCRTEGAEFEALPQPPYHLGRKTAWDFLRFTAAQPRLSRQIGALIKRHNIDLLYVNGPRLVPAAAWASQRQNCRILFHCHSYFPQWYAAGLAGRALRSAGATLVANSRFAAAPLEPWLPNPRIVYNGVSDCARPRTNLDNATRLGVIGRIAPAKGQAEFLETARLLFPSIAKARFVICGAPLLSEPGYLEQVRWRAAGLPVDFLGWRVDIARVLSELDLLVVPSRARETTTRVIPEAFSAGVPVVALRSGGIEEIVEDGQTGFLVDGHTPEVLAGRIRYVLSLPPEALARARKAARSAWERRFTLACYRRQLIELLVEAVEQPTKQDAGEHRQ